MVEETQEPTVVEPETQGPVEVVLPGPDITALQAEKSGLETRLRDLEKQVQGKDRTITTLQRRANEIQALQERLEGIDQKLDTLAKFALREEEEAEPLPPSKYDQFSQEVKKARPVPTPTYSPEEIKAGKRLNELLAAEGIDPDNPSDDLREGIRDAESFWAARRPDRAVKAVEDALAQRRVKKEEELGKQETAKTEAMEREKKAATLQRDKTPSVGSSLNPMSFESLDKKASGPGGVNNLNFAEMERYQAYLVDRVRQGKL